MRQVRCSPGPRFRGWSGANRPALLYQLRLAPVCAKRVIAADLLASQPERDPRNRRQWITGGAVYAPHGRRQRSDLGVEVVLGLVVIAFGQVIQAQVEFDPAANRLCQTQVENGVPGATI